MEDGIVTDINPEEAKEFPLKLEGIKIFIPLVKVRILSLSHE
jgi:hypothetical protein